MNLNDKDIASDVLSMTKHGIEELTKASAECSNARLRQTLRQMRDRSEQAHDQISQIAVANRWYLPSAPADHREVQHVQSFLAAGSGVQTAPPGTGYREQPRPPLG